MRNTDIMDYRDGLIVRSEKRASSLEHLSLFELEELMKAAEVVEYTGRVNTGETKAPEWPRAALGVDSAGRQATPEERREQSKTVTPDIQHVQPQTGGADFEKKVAALVVKLANPRVVAGALRHPPPVPAAARMARPAGSVFAPAPGPSPFMGLGPAPAKLAPARPLPAGSMQTSQFLARQPGGPQLLESVGAIHDVANMPNKAQSLTLGRRLGIGTDVAAHRAHLANQQGMTHLAHSQRVAEIMEQLMKQAAPSHMRDYLTQVVRRHSVVRSAIPDLATTGERLRAAAAARATGAPPVKVFSRPAGYTPPGTPPPANRPIPGSGRRRPLERADTVPDPKGWWTPVTQPA